MQATLLKIRLFIEWSILNVNSFDNVLNQMYQMNVNFTCANVNHCDVYMG